MARWGSLIGLGIAAFLALAFATDDMCAGLTPGRLRAFFVIAVFVGAAAGIFVQRRFSGRPEMPWLWSVAAGTAAFMLLVVGFVVYWGGECSA